MARSPELARLFQLPDLPAQRHYEICRAYFHDETPADEIAQRFHLHVGSVRAIVRDFARDPDVNAFFATARPGRKTSPKRDAIHQRARELRRQGATLADIRAALQREGFDVSESYLFRILRRAGLATTRQGRPLRQPGDYANDGSLVPDIADARALVLEDGRQFPTKVAGLFLFLPLLLDLDLPQAVTHAKLPGSEQIPPLQALLALLVAKLLGKRRVSHISDLFCDEGAGLFAGLNVLPKATYATDYSYKTEWVMTERLIAAVIAKTPLGEPPLSFNLDFHAIPFRGTEPDLENHWVPMRNRALPAVMAFVAQAVGRRVLCYATANFLRDEAENMVPRFADYWKEQTGHYPARLRFDARDHLCRVEPTEPTPDWFHHHPPPRVGDVGSRETPAHGPLAALPNHSGQRKAPPGPGCRGIGGTRWLRRRRAATDRDGAGARIPELLLDQRPSASADGPRNDPDLREPESRREPLR
jgi:transposase